MPTTSRALLSRRGRTLRVGSIVRVVAIPTHGYSTLPANSRRVFRLIIGHRFRVRSITDPPGVLELNVAGVVDRAVGSIGNTVWLEPECVE